MNSSKKDPYDRTSTARGERLSSGMKAAGGAAFTVRFKTAAELGQLDELVNRGFGSSRNEVLRRLVAERFEKLKTEEGGSPDLTV
jgi:hypothetical protein